MGIERGPQFNIPEKESGHEEIEKIWEGVEQEARGFYKEYVAERAPKVGLEPERFEERIEKCLESEKRFLKWVWEEAKRMHSQTPSSKHEILFDIDDTIAEAKWENGSKEPVATYVRPATKVLLKNLRALYPESKIGFITIRQKDRVEKDLKDPKHLKEVEEFIDKDSIYTTESSSLDPSGLDLNDVKELIKSFSIVRNNENMDLVAASISSGSELQKLDILRDLQENNPDTEFMVVDNDNFPEYIKYGVSLTREFSNAVFPHL